MAGSYDFTIEKGTYWSRALTWNVDNAPQDLTGYHAHMQIRTEYADQAGTVCADLTDDEDGGIILGGSAGTIQLILDGAQTGALTFTSAVYDLLLTDPTGKPTRLLEGVVTLSDAVTSGS
jgi:hypothetical protein